MQVEHRTGQVRRPETNVLPLCHATTTLWLLTESFTYIEVTAEVSDWLSVHDVTVVFTKQRSCVHITWQNTIAMKHRHNITQNRHVNCTYNHSSYSAVHHSISFCLLLTSSFPHTSHLPASHPASAVSFVWDHTATVTKRPLLSH